MFSSRVLTSFLLAIMVIMAVFGVPFALSNMHHDVGCPYMPGTDAMCPVGFLAHLGHWQTAFLGVIINTFAFYILALAFFGITAFARPPDRHYIRLRSYDRRTPRSTLLQILFARGLIHSKAF